VRCGFFRSFSFPTLHVGYALVFPPGNGWRRSTLPSLSLAFFRLCPKSFLSRVSACWVVGAHPPDCPSALNSGDIGASFRNGVGVPVGLALLLRPMPYADDRQEDEKDWTASPFCMNSFVEGAFLVFYFFLWRFVGSDPGAIPNLSLRVVVLMLEPAVLPDLAPGNHNAR